VTTEHTALRPRLRPDVVLGPGLRAGPRTVHRVTDRTTGCSYRVGAREHFVMRLMDGRHTTDDIGRAYEQEYGKALGPDSWRQIHAMLGRHLLLSGHADAAALDRLRAEREAREARRTGRGTWYSRRWVLARPDRLCDTLARALAPAFRPPLVVLGLLLAAAVQVLVWTRLDQLLSDAADQPPPLVAVPLFLLLVWALTAVHELAHGTACRHFGGRVAEIGMRWRLPFLVPYCRTDDIMLFPGRAARVGTAFAGIHAVLLLMAPLALVRTLAPEDGTLRAVSAALLLFGSAGSLAALLPFLAMDGQAMLAHALGRTDIGRETWRYCTGRITRAARGGHTRGDAVFHAVYGAAACAFFVLGYGLLMRLWYDSLRAWNGPGFALAVLAVENVVALVIAAALLRRRTSPTRKAADG
jgi:putative peptide zinc metalloprotease protein